MCICIKSDKNKEKAENSIVSEQLPLRISFWISEMCLSAWAPQPKDVSLVNTLAFLSVAKKEASITCFINLHGYTTSLDMDSVCWGYQTCTSHHQGG